MVSDRWRLNKNPRGLTSTKAEEECYINEGVGSGENLRKSPGQDAQLVLGGKKSTHRN